MGSIDIIVPCYRYGHFLRECMESILTESSVSIRVLIIDDASPDNTAEIAEDIAKKDSRVTFLRHKINKGHIATYNEGIEWVSADYMLLLSADDYLLPGALRRAIEFMDANPDIVFTFGKAILIKDNENKTKKKLDIGKSGYKILKGLEFIEFSGSRNVVFTPTVVVKAELIKRLGGYRPELPCTADMEMWLRMAAHGSVGFLQTYQAAYRYHDENMGLLYVKDKSLPELQQRKAALDYFFQTCSSILPDPQKLYFNFHQRLSNEAIRCANAAFNDKDLDLAKRLSEFSVSIFPEVDQTFGWKLLIAKESLGFNTWRMFKPIETLIRKSMTSKIVLYLFRKIRKRL